jgi:hypothetical protein
MELKTTFEKLSDEIKEKISLQLETKEVQEMLAKIKSSEDSGSFEVVISTGDIDRAGESIDPEGWDLGFYKSNPVVLWAHDYLNLPVGMTESVEKKDGKLIARGKFAPAEANPFAQQVRMLYDNGFVRTASVGFIEKERKDNLIIKAELLEWSFVPVPANPFALSTLSKAGIDTEAFITKGLIVPIKEENEKPDQEQEPAVPDLAEKINEQFIKLQTTIEVCSKNIIEALEKKQFIVALDEKLQGGKPGEGAKNGREPAGLKELEDFLFLRQVLQKVDKVIEDGLRKTKEKIRNSMANK